MKTALVTQKYFTSCVPCTQHPLLLRFMWNNKINSGDDRNCIFQGKKKVQVSPLKDKSPKKG